MRPICRSRVEVSIGRYITDREARDIEFRLKRSAAYLQKNDASFFGLSRADRMKAAARHAQDALDAEVGDTLRAFDLEFQLRQAGRKAVGEDFDRLEAAGRLRFENRPADLDPGLADDASIAAAYSPQEGVVIFRERVTPEMMENVLLHEAGAHMGLPAMLGERGYRILRDSMGELSAKGAPEIEAARAKIPLDTPSEHFFDEFLAYTVETGLSSGPIQKMLATVKAWAIRAFPDLAPYLADAQTLRALAAMAIRAAARRTGGYALGERMFVKGAKAVAGVDDSAARAAFEKRLLHADPAFDTARMDEAWDMHQRYKAAKARPGDLLDAFPGENGPTRSPAEELRRLDRMVERFRGCVLP